MPRAASRAIVTGVIAALLATGAFLAPKVGAVDGPRVSVGDASGLERDSTTGSVFVPIYLSQTAVDPVVVSYYSSDGTALAGSDYSRWGTPAAPRTVTVPAGSLQTTVNVPVAADSLIEADEQFSIVVQSVSGASATVGDGTGVATIVDSDVLAGPNPVINVSSGSVTEGDAGQRKAQFQIHLSRAPSSNVTIAYSTADGTALAGSSTGYVAKLPGSVVFAPGQISKTIDVLVPSDTAVGGDRQFRLDVVVTGGSPVEELSMSGTATIADDDTVTTTTTTTTTSSTTTTSTSTTTTTLPGTPTITSWALAGTPGPVPALVPLRWTISNPAGGTLTCRIDGADDGVFEVVVNNCPTTGSRNVATTTAGQTTARLRVESTVGGAVEAERWIIASADPVETYDVQLRGIASLGTSEAAAFTAAEQRLEGIVVRGVADVGGVPARPSCLPSTSPDLPSTVDDLLIDVAVQPIDGAGGILGQAGPNCLRSGSFLPLSGQMIFDSADVAMLLADGSFSTVVLHEMSHVLGYGTIWASTNSATGTGGTDPRYIGGRGVAEWSALGGTGNVPLEDTGAAGTRDNHWRESVFGSELMTGYLNSGSNPVSRLSIASFADLGYQVDVTRADAYALPAPLSGLRLFAASSTAPAELAVQRPPAGTL